MAEMTKRERIMAAIRGEPVDRIPAIFFGHFHTVECAADTLASHMLAFNRKFDWDFVKVQNRNSFYGEAWGCKYRFDPERGPQIEDPIIKKADHFRKIKKLDPKKGEFGEQIRVIELLNEALRGSIPIAQPIFNPLSVAARLAGAMSLAPTEATPIKRFMEENPEALHYGLSVISQTLADFAREAIRAGAEGVMTTTTVFSGDTMSEEQYRIFGIPYDLPIYEAAIKEGATINGLHLCRENIMLNILSDYPVQILSYDVRSPRNPGWEEVRKIKHMAFWGGINQNTTLLHGPIEAIIAEVHDSLKQTGGKRFILGPGCACPPTPEAHLIAAKEALSTWRKD